MKSKAAKLFIFKIFIIFTIVAVTPLSISAIFYWSSFNHSLAAFALGEGLSLKLDLLIVLSNMFKFTVNNINIVNNFIQEVLLNINSLMQAHVLVPASVPCFAPAGASQAEGYDFNLGKPACPGRPACRPWTADAGLGRSGGGPTQADEKPAFGAISVFSQDWS